MFTTLIIAPCVTIAVCVLILSISACDSNGGEVIKAFLRHRAETREREQRHRQYMEMLAQLEKIASFEGLAKHDADSEYAKLRTRLLSELDSSLNAAAAADGKSADKERVAS